MTVELSIPIALTAAGHAPVQVEVDLDVVKSESRSWGGGGGGFTAEACRLGWVVIQDGFLVDEWVGDRKT